MSEAMLSPDQLLPVYQFSERHRCRIAARPATVLDAAAAYRPENDSLIKKAIYLRELPNRLLNREDSLAAPFGIDNFTLLSRTDSFLVFGLVGAFWRLDYGLYPIADADGFAAFGEKDAAKLLLFFSVKKISEEYCELLTETRVFCPDLVSRIKFAPYWMLIRPVSGFIRRRTLLSIKAASERQIS